MKRAASLKLKGFFLGGAAAVLLIHFSTPAYAATLFTSDVSSCSGYGHGNLRVEDQSLTIPSASTITSFVLRVSVSSGESSARIRIYNDNADNPGTLLGTFTYSSISGTLVTYSGTATLPSAGKYWLRFSTTASFNPCYNFNPLFTGSLPGWSVGKVRESTDSGSTFTARTDNLSFLFTINGTGGGSTPIATSLSLSGSQSISFRQSITSVATLGVAGSDGRVTFFADGKKIVGCINKTTVSLSVSCDWKPSRRGVVALTASLTPSDSGYAASKSPARMISIGNRTNLR